MIKDIESCNALFNVYESVEVTSYMKSSSTQQFEVYELLIVDFVSSIIMELRNV